MSVIRNNTGNEFNDIFSNLIEFDNMKIHLIREDIDGFIRWFDKLRVLDPRSTWLYLLTVKDQLTNEQIEYIEATYKRKLKEKNNSKS